jgi:hypothetical protein
MINQQDVRQIYINIDDESLNKCGKVQIFGTTANHNCIHEESKELIKVWECLLPFT